MRIALIANCDDAVLFWSVDKPVKDCWGFAIERELKMADGQVRRTTLDNRTGFEKDRPKSGDHRPSTEWPFQRFWWADHSVNIGDRVRYRVCPMIRANGALHEQVDQRSDWTRWTQLTGVAADGFSSFFNRGLVISQFMSRYLESLRVREKLETRKDALKAFKDSLGEHELPIRKFLSGALRNKMLELLAKAKKDGQHVYGALYELDDDELIEALAALRSRAHIVLANGSITAKKGEGAAAARKRDQNKDGRKALRAANVEVFDRFISPGALGHNKFLVFAGKKGSKVSPKLVWTGSTNWTSTGLCTQINNGLVVDAPSVAESYYAQWESLRDAGSAFPAELVDANSEPRPLAAGKSKGQVWFTRTRGKVDLAALTKEIKGARDAVLFLMFQPGGAGALGDVRALQKAQPGLYVKGVVSTLPAAPKPDAEGEESEVSVALEGDTRLTRRFDIVQPQGIRHPFASWAATVTRDEFITRQGGVIGFAIVHSKLIVIDPFTRPVVITGSHNFSGAASTKNDENFVIVRGNRALAEHYAAHILSVYQHYRWLAFVDDQQRKGRNPKGFLRESDAWQAGMLKGAGRKELDFWLSASDDA